MIADWLKSHRYDGLYNADDVCGCLLDDLAPCEDFSDGDCEPGYKANCTEDCDHGGPCKYHLQRDKPKE